MTWLGVETAKCRAATPAIGPSGLCGATPTEKASAMAAIFLASRRPPQWQMSGCTMLTTRAARRSADSGRSARGRACAPAMEIPHDLDFGPDRAAQRFHHPADFFDLRQGCVVMRVGDEHG